MKKEYSVDEIENERLARQNRLIQKYLLKKWYEKFLSRKGLKVLDIGSNNGNAIMTVLLPKLDVIDKFVGIEKNQDCVNVANKKYGSKKIKFFAVDVESQNFEQQLKDIMKKFKIHSFDFINITSLLLLLKQPDKFLKSISKFLSKDGELFILDIDDGFTKWSCNSNKAGYYDQIYSRAMQICFKSKTTGNRFSGREILKYLSACNLQNCKILNQENNAFHGLQTNDMPMKDREAFAYMLFDFIERGVTSSLKENPQNLENLEDYEWFIKNKPNLIDGFMDKNLNFNLGYMIFSAKEKTCVQEFEINKTQKTLS